MDERLRRCCPRGQGVAGAEGFVIGAEEPAPGGAGEVADPADPHPRALGDEASAFEVAAVLEHGGHPLVGAAIRQRGGVVFGSPLFVRAFSGDSRGDGAGEDRGGGDQRGADRRNAMGGTATSGRTTPGAATGRTTGGEGTGDRAEEAVLAQVRSRGRCPHVAFHVAVSLSRGRLSQPRPANNGGSPDLAGRPFLFSMLWSNAASHERDPLLRSRRNKNRDGQENIRKKARPTRS